MGSSGSGSFSDYSNKPSDPTSSSAGGSSGIDKCTLAFATSLEEVSRCAYYMRIGSLPVVGTDVDLVFNGLRLAICTKRGEEIGFLPTKFNYLKNCLDNGFRYSGVVRAAMSFVNPSVLVDIVPV